MGCTLFDQNNLIFFCLPSRSTNQIISEREDIQIVNSTIFVVRYYALLITRHFGGK